MMKGVFDMELKVTQLTKQYGPKTAVDHLDITLSNGVYGLLGANGAGKTTLMRLLCNIQTPTFGKITLDGKDISVLGERYRNLLGYLPQHFRYYPEFTAWDFLMYVAALKGLSEKQAKNKTSELLEVVDLSKEGHRKIKTFSGGMKQRLGIAQAMLNNPRILILDEPTAGLDPKERVRFRNLISAFSKDRIVILSTHIVSDVEFIAEEIIMMKAGRVLHFGRPQEITEEIEGYVWECMVPTRYAEQYSGTLNVSNLRNIENECTVLRVISESKPMENAVQVKPIDELAIVDAFEAYTHFNVWRVVNKKGYKNKNYTLDSVNQYFKKIEETSTHPYIYAQKARILLPLLRFKKENREKIKECLKDSFEKTIISVETQYINIKGTISYAFLF